MNQLGNQKVERLIRFEQLRIYGWSNPALRLRVHKAHRVTETPDPQAGKKCTQTISGTRLVPRTCRSLGVFFFYEWKPWKPTKTSFKDKGYSRAGLWGMTTSVIQQKGPNPKDYFLHKGDSQKYHSGWRNPLSHNPGPGNPKNSPRVRHFQMPPRNSTLVQGIQKTLPEFVISRCHPETHRQATCRAVRPLEGRPR